MPEQKLLTPGSVETAFFLKEKEKVTLPGQARDVGYQL